MVLPNDFTFRLRGPILNEAALRERLSQAIGDTTPEDIRIQSLATSLEPCEIPTKTATLMFAKLPSVIETQIKNREWKFKGHGLILDTHFYGLTPLNDVEAHQHAYNCIAISGLASHPFGSWQTKGDRSWMWIRDALPKALPTTRVVLFGYDSTLVNSNSFQTVADLASCFIENLKASTLLSSSKPLIFLAHSLGGIVFKEALVALANGGDRERQILRHVAGAVLFGVPSRGMETQALTAMVRGQATEGLVRDLTAKSGYLQSLEDRFFEVALSGMKLFWAYETRTSATVAKQESGAFDRTGPEKVLVTRESATRGLHGTSSSTFPINENHSDMVKFREGDLNCQVVIRKLREICAARQDSVVTSKLARQERRWVVPFGRNRDFVGRESILAQLLERIPPSTDRDDCQRTAIEGLGGIGKTQIALEAAFRVRDSHPDCSVFWIPAVNATSFENAYREIGRELKIEGIGDDKADIKLLVKTALSRKSASSWLLIIDNADDTELFATPLSECLPFSCSGSILVTTRNHEVTVELDIPERNIITTAEMDSAEATKMFRRTLKEGQMRDTASTTSLLEFLTYLPLAIKQASAHMAKTRISTTQYLNYCRSSDQNLVKLLSKDFQDYGRYKTIKNPVATTWLISFEHISRDPLAADYLRFVCFLAEKAIPMSLLPPVEDDIAANEAIGTLKGYAFISEREEPGLFDMHRLVRLITQNWVEREGKRKECATSVLQRFAEVFPWPEHENRDLWLGYLPHVQAALEFRADCTDEEAEQHVFQKVAKSYYTTGNYQQAEQMHRQTLELTEKVLGQEHPDTLGSMNNLASVLDSLGKYDEAEQMQRQTLKLKEKVLGQEHPDTLGSMNNLASVLDSLGKYDEAEQMQRQTLKLKEKVLGQEHPDTLGSMNNLASVLDSLGKYDEAEQMHRQTLELREKVLGQEHPNTLDSMNNLALVLSSLGKYDEAEQMHQQTLELKEKVLGQEHPNTLDSMNNLASVLDSLGKYNEAEQMYRQTLELREKVLGQEHPSTLDSMDNLASVLSSLGKYDKAEQMYRQTLELSEKVLGQEHPNTLASMNNLASVLGSLGKYNKAKQIHRQTLELKEKVLSQEHPSTLASMNNLASVLDSLGKYDEAEQMHRQTLELREKVLGQEHPDILDSMNNLASVLFRLGKYDEAEQMYRQTLELREKVLGQEHPSTLTSMMNIGNVLDSLGKYLEAEQMHRQTLELTEKVLGQEHPSTLASINNLALVLDSLGKYKEAEQMHQQTLELCQKVLGQEHPRTLNSMNNLALVLDNLGKYNKAKQIHQQTLKLKEKVLGQEHPSTLTSMMNIGNVLSSLGKYNEAEQMHRQTLELREKVLGQEHPDTLDNMNALTLVLSSLGKYNKAEQMHRQTLELTEKVLGQEHPSTLTSINNLALVLDRLGKYKEAEQMHRQTLELCQKVLGQEHPRTLDSMNNFALVLDSLGKYNKAEQMHQQTLKLKEKVLGQEHPSTLTSMMNIGNVLSSLGKYLEAEQMQRQTLELTEKVLGQEHPDTLGSMNNLALVLSRLGKYDEAEQMHRQTLELREKVLGLEHPDIRQSKNNLAACLRAARDEESGP